MRCAIFFVQSFFLTVNWCKNCKPRKKHYSKRQKLFCISRNDTVLEIYIHLKSIHIIRKALLRFIEWRSNKKISSYKILKGWVNTLNLGTKWIINTYIYVNMFQHIVTMKLQQYHPLKLLSITRYLRLRSDSVKALDERSKREKCFFILYVECRDAQHSFWWKHFSRFIQMNLKGIKSCIRWSRINSNTFISSAKNLCVRFRMIYLY